MKIASKKTNRIGSPHLIEDNSSIGYIWSTEDEYQLNVLNGYVSKHLFKGHVKIFKQI